MQPLCFIALGGDEVVDRVQARKLGSKSADLGERGRIDLLEASSNGVHFVARLLLLPRSRPHCTALPRRRSKRFKRPSSAPPRRDSGDARTLDLKTVSWRAPAPRWRRNAAVGFIRPCEPVLVDRPPAGPGWLHEVKHDGFWILARKEGEGQVKIWSRRRWPPKACELGLEGIVSKRQGSFYKSGPSRNWLKTVNPDFVRT
jgi:hypothetical protein